MQGDGIILNRNRDLVVVKNPQLALVRSKDNWASASILQIRDLNNSLTATTAVVDGDFVFVSETSFFSPQVHRYSISMSNLNSTIERVEFDHFENSQESGKIPSKGSKSVNKKDKLGEEAQEIEENATLLSNLNPMVGLGKYSIVVNIFQLLDLE